MTTEKGTKLTMHAHFADWHRLVEIEPRADDLTSRWEVIEGVVPDLTADSAVNMVAVAHGSTPRATEWSNEFAEVFKQADATFPMIDNKALVSMLAAAAAIHAISRADHTADLVAYAVTASATVGRHAAVDDLLPAATLYLLEEGVDQREPDAAPEPLKVFNTMPKALKDAAEAAKHAANPELVDHKAFNTVVSALASMVNSIANSVESHTASVMTWTENAMSPVREELNMLWWLLSAYSTSANCVWTDLDAGAAAVTAGWELAGQVTILPGPPVAPELLRQLLTTTFRADPPAVELADAVTKLTSQVQGPQSIEALADLTPIASQAAGRATSASGDEQHTLVELACRAYTEALLVRAYQAASS